MKMNSEKSFNVSSSANKCFLVLGNFSDFSALYSVFVCYVQKRDVRTEVRICLYQQAYLDTDTIQFPISHIRITSKDAVLSAAQSSVVSRYCLTI